MCIPFHILFSLKWCTSDDHRKNNVFGSTCNRSLYYRDEASSAFYVSVAWRHDDIEATMKLRSPISLTVANVEEYLLLVYSKE